MKIKKKINKKALIVLLILTSLMLSSCSKAKEKKEKSRIDAENKERTTMIGNLIDVESDDGLRFKLERKDSGDLSLSIQDMTKESSKPVYMKSIHSSDKEALRWIRVLIIRDGERYIYKATEDSVERENFIDNFDKYAVFIGREYKESEHKYTDFGDEGQR